MIIIIRERIDSLMYQPPQKTPQQKRRDSLIAIGIIVGVVALALILPMFNTKNPESSIDTGSTTNPTYSNTATGAGSSTQARFYENTATPIKGVNGNPWS